MRYFLFVLLLVVSSCGRVELIKRLDNSDSCREAGKNKVQDQAKAFGVTVDMNTLRLTGSSHRGIASYYWWSVDVTNINGRTDVFPNSSKPVLTKLTQKPLLGKCF